MATQNIIHTKSNTKTSAFHPNVPSLTPMKRPLAPSNNITPLRDERMFSCKRYSSPKQVENKVLPYKTSLNEVNNENIANGVLSSDYDDCFQSFLRGLDEEGTFVSSSLKSVTTHSHDNTLYDEISKLESTLTELEGVETWGDLKNETATKGASVLELSNELKSTFNGNETLQNINDISITKNNFDEKQNSINSCVKLDEECLGGDTFDEEISKLELTLIELETNTEICNDLKNNVTQHKLIEDKTNDEVETNISPLKCSINSKLTWKPKHLFPKQNFYILDEWGEVSGGESSNFQSNNSRACALPEKCRQVDQLTTCADQRLFHEVQSAENSNSELISSKVIEGMSPQVEKSAHLLDHKKEDKRQGVEVLGTNVSGQVLLSEDESIFKDVVILNEQLFYKDQCAENSKNEISSKFSKCMSPQVEKSAHLSNHEKGTVHLENLEILKDKSQEVEILYVSVNGQILLNKNEKINVNDVVINEQELKCQLQMKDSKSSGDIVAYNEDKTNSPSKTNHENVVQLEKGCISNVIQNKADKNDLQDARTSEGGLKASESQVDLVQDEINHTGTEKKCENVMQPANEDYISNDPQENADNNNPEWEVLRKLETDEERYKGVRQRWRSLVIPHPNQNLTYIHCRYNKNTVKNTASISINSPKGNDKKRKGRKRTRSVEPACTNPKSKRARTQSCTTVFDRKMEELKRTAEDERIRLFDAQRAAMQHLGAQQSVEQSQLMYLRNNSYSFSILQDQLYLKQQEDFAHLQNRYAHALHTAQTTSQNQMNAVLKAIEEVKAFHSFYQGLDTNSSDKDCLTLTDTELEDVLEYEKLSECYKTFYK